MNKCLSGSNNNNKIAEIAGVQIVQGLPLEVDRGELEVLLTDLVGLGQHAVLAHVEPVGGIHIAGHQLEMSMKFPPLLRGVELPPKGEILRIC